MTSIHGTAMQPHLPVPDAETAGFWRGTAAHKFLLRHCNNCDRAHFYPRHACPYCWSENGEWRPASGRGRIYSYTVIHYSTIAPFREMLPYIVAWIDLEENVRVTSNIVECTPDLVHVGMPVEVVYERVTDEVTLPKFRPLMSYNASLEGTTR
jgi:uncharacterized OB-fold protein